MGYKNCVDCSTVEKYGCVDIIYHKTGNTIEVMDHESAEKISKMSKRRGFGSMTAMRGGSGGKPSVPSNVSVKKFNSSEDFEKAGEEAMKEYEAMGFSYAICAIEKFLSNKTITPLQAKNLRVIFEALETPKTPEIPKKKIEPEESVDPEILKLMRNWKH